MLPFNHKIIAWLCVLGLIALIILYAIELGHIGNTIGYLNLIWKSILISIFIGVLLGRQFQGKGEELVDKIRIWSACILLPAFFAPLLGSLTNRNLSDHISESKTFEFIEEKAFVSSAYGLQKRPDGCYLFVFYDGKIERFKRKECHYLALKRGEEISLTIKKGLWGYEVVLP